MQAIMVDDLNMTYRVPVREPGLRAAAVALVRRQYREIPALRSISFQLEPGALVGFIGPNGAGKTTCLKILSGVLYPGSGVVRVLGYTPWRREADFLRQIAVVRGSRPLPAPGELTVLDALRFQQAIYQVPETQFRRNLSELVELLELELLLQRQVRALSLGERMRAGIAWALLYRPRVLFLDEPTLGLDVSAIRLMRQFIASYNQQTGATILLTSHMMTDVEQLCQRVIVIDHGRLVFDGALAQLSARLAPYKLLSVVTLEAVAPDWQAYGEVLAAGPGRATLRVLREEVPAIIGRLVTDLAIVDLSVNEPPLESIIDQVYRGAVAAV